MAYFALICYTLPVTLSTGRIFVVKWKTQSGCIQIHDVLLEQRLI